MASNKSKYLSDILLNWEEGTATPTPPTNLYLALLTTMPTNNAGLGLVEVAGTSYARQQITPAMWAAITTSASFVENATTNAALTWPAAGSAWGTVVGVAEYDAATAGNLLRFGSLTSGSQLVAVSNIFSIPAGSLTRTET